MMVFRTDVLGLLLFSTTLVLSCASAIADTALLMFERDGCPYCLQWWKEVGSGYPKTPEGRVAPIQRVDWRTSPAGVKLARPITMTPTFVLVKDGLESGRITGYPGADFFYWMLEGVLEQAGVRPDRGQAAPGVGPPR